MKKVDLVEKPEWCNSLVKKEVVDSTIQQVDEALEIAGEDYFPDTEGVKSLIKSFEGKTMDEVCNAILSLFFLLDEEAKAAVSLSLIPPRIRQILIGQGFIGTNSQEGSDSDIDKDFSNNN